MGVYMKNFLIVITIITILILFVKTTKDAPIVLDWRFNEFRQRGINVEEVFEVKCILGYYYHTWPEKLIGIPMLDNNANKIKCIDTP